MATHSIAIPCTADTYLDRYSSSTNFGSSSVLYVHGYTGSTTKYAAVLGFDLSSIPLNKTITNMSVSFYFDKLWSEGMGQEVTAGVDFVSSYHNVILARRLKTVNFNDIETTLNASVMLSKSGTENVFSTSKTDYDRSIDLNYKSRSWVTLDIADIERTSDGKCIIGLARDNDNTNFTARWDIYSRNSSYVPFLSVTYDDYLPPKPSNLIPNSTIRNSKGDIKLNWNFYDGTTLASQSSYEIQYSTNGFSTYSTLNGNTSNNYHVIPANTFTSGQIVQWRVRVTDTNGDVTDFSDIVSFTIGATNPSKPELVSPVNTIINSSDSNTFRWKFIDTYGYQQGGFYLEYYKTGESSATIQVNSVLSQHTFAKNTLSGGNYSWRIKTYNQFGEPSEWSEWSTYYSIGKPDIPYIINITNNMHPVITWGSSEQDLYRIRIYQGFNILFDTGEQASKETNSYTVLEFLPNGSYTASISISNVYGLWSDWSDYNFSINTVVPKKPSFNALPVEQFVSMILESETANTLIYRRRQNELDFTLVKSIDISTYKDYEACNGINEYFVRAITSDSYCDSDIQKVLLKFKGITIAGLNNITKIISFTKTFDDDKYPTEYLSKTQFKTYLNGRQYPILQTIDKLSLSRSYEYFIKEDDLLKFKELWNGNNVFFIRTSDANCFSCELTNLVINRNSFGYVVGFTVNKVDWS